MSKDFSLMEDSNRSANPSIHEVSSPARRTVLRGGAGAGDRGQGQRQLVRPGAHGPRP